MRFTLLLLVFVLLTKFKELLQDLNRGLKITLFLINETNFLVTLSFFMDVSSLLRNVHAFVVELERHLVLTFYLVLLSDLLIDTDEILQNFDFDSFKIAFRCLVKGGFKLTHSFKLVLNVLLTISETLVG